MKSGFLLNIVVGKGAAIFQLFTSKNQSLLIWRNTFFVLDLGLDVFNGVGGFDFQSDGLASESLDENLHAATKTKDQMECRFLLDIVVGKSAAVFQLFTSENQSLLIWGDSFLVLDLGLDIFDGIRGLDFQGDGFASESLDENLHATTKTKDQMEGGFLLDV